MNSSRDDKIAELFKVGKPYIALETGPGFNFEWPPVQVKEVITAWEAGKPLLNMASTLGRDPDEVAVLIMDLRRRGIIRNRPGGMWGKGAVA